MNTVNIHEAKTHLSRLIAAASDGEPFVISKVDRTVMEWRNDSRLNIPAALRVIGSLPPWLSRPATQHPASEVEVDE